VTLPRDANAFLQRGRRGGVATIIGCELPDPYFERVASARADVVAEFGVDEYANPFPHFTLAALPEDADAAAVAHAVEAVTEDQPPFAVQTDGLGVFPQHVVWLPVAKSPDLAAFHAETAAAVEDFGTPPVPYYQPHRWFPHVGFGVADDAAEAGAIVEYLLDYDFDWSFTVDTVTVTRPPEPGEQYEKLAQFDL
jgi:2'-5' RNA ligase